MEHKAIEKIEQLLIVENIPHYNIDILIYWYIDIWCKYNVLFIIKIYINIFIIFFIL